MSAGISAESAQLDRAENLIQIVLAAVVPGILAAMLFSYVIYDSLFAVLFFAAIAVAALMMIPAIRMHKLHFRTWHRNSLPPKLVTSIIGMIYITAISVFAVSLLSLYEGLHPEQPMTFALEGGLLLLLLGVMSYNSRNKERFLCMEKRFFDCGPEEVEARLMQALSKMGHKHHSNRVPTGAHIELPEHGLRFRIVPLNKRTSEVLVENVNDSNHHVLAEIKEHLKSN